MAVLLIFIALLQGVPIAPQASGTVSGILRNPDGTPAFGVRVSAMPRDDSIVGALASLTETDQEGKFSLENIPPGQYYIVAGNLDKPTYYPGTQDVAKAQNFQVTPGSRSEGLSFVVVDPSRSQPNLFNFNVPRVLLTLRVMAEPGDRLPVQSSTGPLTVEFQRLSDGTIAGFPTISATNILLDTSAPATDYRVRVLNLPAGFTMSSISYDKTPIASGILSFRNPVNSSSQSPVGLVITTGSVLDITIAEDRSVSRNPAGTGVRVGGLGRRSSTHPVSLSGRLGNVYADGSFEFSNVPPGRHVIALMDSPGRALGTTVVVGDGDVENLILDEIAALPVTIQSPVPVLNETASPGTKLPPAVLRGRVMDPATQQPPSSGQVRISGQRGPITHLEPDGTYEVRGLLPGLYRVELQVAGYSSLSRELQVGVEDLTVDFQLER